MKSEKRVQSLDVVKGLGILFVLAGHTIGEGKMTFYGSAFFHRCIYSFHMSLFFIVSGILLGKSMDEREWNKDYYSYKISSVTRRLLCPYILWSFIYWMLADIKTGNTDIREWVYCVISFRGRAPIWFLGALFWTELCSVGIIYFCKKERYKIRTVLIALVMMIVILQRISTPPDALFYSYMRISFLRGLLSLFFELAGVEMSKWILRKHTVKVDTGMGVLLGIICVYVCWRFRAGGNFHTFGIKNVPLYLLTGITGSLSIILLCKVLSNVWLKNCLEKIGKNSMGIMALHYTTFPFMRYASFIAEKIKIDGFAAFLFVFCFIFFCAYLGTEIIKKNYLV